jgi:hypothetical protein
MTKLTLSSGLLGLLVGLAISAYAHAGNGFETGPLVFLGLTTSVLGGLVSGFLILAMGKRGHLVSAIGAFSVAVLLALVAIPIVWPYQKALGPMPLDSQPGATAPKMRRCGFVWQSTQRRASTSSELGTSPERRVGLSAPDRVIVTPARMEDPQQFNLYAYARNNPFKFIDPNDEDIDFANDTEEGRKKALALITKNLSAKERRTSELGRQRAARTRPMSLTRMRLGWMPLKPTPN